MVSAINQNVGFYGNVNQNQHRARKIGTTVGLATGLTASLVPIPVKAQALDKVVQEAINKMPKFMEKVAKFGNQHPGTLKNICKFGYMGALGLVGMGIGRLIGACIDKAKN